MRYKAVLFDLDGTLLPMNQDSFIKKYFSEISRYMYTKGGYDPEAFMMAMGVGIKAMIKNDGKETNEQAFWKAFSKFFGKERVEKDLPVFDSFYVERFPCVKSECSYTEYSRNIVDYLRERGTIVVLATNPVFPPIATNTRMGWVDLKPEDFNLVTTYENIGYCKPNPDYFTDIAKRIGVKPSECLMVGNDVGDDMPARYAGMEVFLLTDCLINAKNEDVSEYLNGSFKDLFEYLKKSQED